jgi:hypothetical protein
MKYDNGEFYEKSVSSFLFSFRCFTAILYEDVHTSLCVSRQILIGEKIFRTNAVKKIGRKHFMFIAFFCKSFKIFVTIK